MAPVNFLDVAKFLTSADFRKAVGESYKALFTNKDGTVQDEIGFQIRSVDRPRFRDCAILFSEIMERNEFSRNSINKACVVFSEIVDNSLLHGCRSDRNQIHVKCKFTVGGVSISVRQPSPFPQEIRDYVALDAVRDWETFNRGSAIGMQTIVHLSDHIGFEDRYTITCSVYKKEAVSTDVDPEKVAEAERKRNLKNEVIASGLANDPKFKEYLEEDEAELSIENVARIGGIRVVGVSGRVDHTNSHEFDSELNKLADIGDGIILDFGRLQFLVSAGLRSLLLLQRSLNLSGKKLEIACVDGVVKEVFRISKFDALLRIHPDVNSAIATSLYDARVTQPKVDA